MSDDRLEQARAEAKMLTGGLIDPYSMQWAGGFERGVLWADANPKPLAFSEVDRICNYVVPSDQYEVVEVLEALGIEVTDDAE